MGPNMKFWGKNVKHKYDSKTNFLWKYEEKHEEKIKIDDKIKNCLHILSSRVDGIFVEKERL